MLNLSFIDYNPGLYSTFLQGAARPCDWLTLNLLILNDLYILEKQMSVVISLYEYLQHYDTMETWLLLHNLKVT